MLPPWRSSPDSSRPGARPGLRHAAASGITSGVASALTQTLTVAVTDHSGGPLFSWRLLTVALLVSAFAMGGLLLSQTAYRGGLGAPLAVVTLANPVAAAAIGLALLGERLQGGPVSLVLALLGTAAAVRGVVLLSRAQARNTDPAAPPEAPVPGDQVPSRVVIGSPRRADTAPRQASRNLSPRTRAADRPRGGKAAGGVPSDRSAVQIGDGPGQPADPERLQIDAAPQHQIPQPVLVGRRRGGEVPLLDLPVLRQLAFVQREVAA